jgi:hypothetical protein
MNSTGFEHVQAKENEASAMRRQQLFGDAAPAADRLGVALSGGGIRSATFNLGVLQGLTERGLLPFIDYLSTVSGGGYIGTWLHGVISAEAYGKGDPRVAAPLLMPDRPPAKASDDPIQFLRKYSSYLAPRGGLFSADSWVIAAIWTRNVILNQLILVPFLAVALLLPVLLGFVKQQAAAWSSWFGLSANIWAAAFCIFIAVTIAGANLRRLVAREFRGELRRRGWVERAPGISVCIVLFFAAAVLAGGSAFHPLEPKIGPFGVPAVFYVSWLLLGALQWLGGFPQCWCESRKTASIPLVVYAHTFWMSGLAAAAATLLLAGAGSLTGSWPDIEGSWMRLAWGPPLITLALSASAALLVGLMGADFPDAPREWLSRLATQIGMVAAAWAAAFALGVFGPLWMGRILQWSYTIGSAAALAWAASSIGGALAGASSKTGSGSVSGKADLSGKALELLGKVAPSVFIAGMLLTIGTGIHAALDYGTFRAPVIAGASAPAGASPVWLGPSLDRYWRVMDANERWAVGARAEKEAKKNESKWNRTRHVAAGAAALIALFLLLSMRININEFSMHHFYKNRLVRCYLGTSRGNRRYPDPYIGFDPRDDRPLTELDILRPANHPPYLGPYAILNSTINLNAGSDLAQRERRGDSFVFTPQFCGFTPRISKEDERAAGGISLNGYQPTWGYLEAHGPGMGTATAICGAALNPNHGYHTSGPLAFLMTMFNVRLGWWTGNPRLDGPSKTPGPRLALWYLIKELMALTDSRTSYVNLADGGNFDNLGLYELVRRRCPLIVVGDAEEDGALQFHALGGAIRKCRADFGVEIDIDVSRIRKSEKSGNPADLAHCAVGRIRYLDNECGYLVYLKASITGDEPEDVLEFHNSFPEFPHQSTADQFFTESQFESYRRLGLHVVRSVFEDVRLVPQAPLWNLFEALSKKWPLPERMTERRGSLPHQMA